MDIPRLRAFIAVAEELHFGRAAERLHVAQPPLSRTIQQLERELDAKLFDRSTRSVRLTAAGTALLGPAREVMDSLRGAEAAVRAAGRGEVGVVRIAFAGASSYQLVAEWARRVRQQLPGIRLELYSQNFAIPAMRKLIDDEIDVALGRWDHIPAAIEARVASADSIVIALPDTHRLAGQSVIDFAELRDEGFITLPPVDGAVLSDRLRRLAHGAGFSADIVQVAPDSLSALALVGAEVGCHLTLASVARHTHQSHVTFVRLRDETSKVDLQLARRADDQNPALGSVLALVDDLLGAQATPG